MTSKRVLELPLCPFSPSAMLLVACKGSVSDVELDADMQTSSEAMMEESSSSVEAMMDESSSSVEAMEVSSEAAM
jgi:hypothetical protein